MEQIKIGVFGVGRGMDIAKNFMLQNCDVVAICDNHKERLAAAVEKLGDTVAVYDSFDEFLKHDMDAVIVANFFHQHAPYTVRLLEKGIHVFGECISNGTMAEGVELCRAYEKYKDRAIYMLAENYPQMLFNREIKRICDGGSLGKILYAEGEYNHPADPNDVRFKKTYNYFTGHWRNYLPRTYYVTHSLGPIMWATGATPKRVTAMAAFAPIEEDVPTASYVGDRAAVILTQNDDGSIFRFTGCAAFGAHHNSYRVCGTEGQVENLRGMGNKVMLRYNEWSKTDDAPKDCLYEPAWNDPDEALIKKSGHGGGDFLTAKMFLQCIREGRQPEHPFDLYSAVNMSSVAILAHRSVLEGGTPYDIPDFRTEEARKQYENDRTSPFLGEDGTAPGIPCCTHSDFKPTEKQVELFKKIIQ